MSKEREELARYLLQHSADDAPHEPQATEYERLQAALARLQGLDCFVEVWLGEKSFFITIYDPQYTTTETCGGVGATLLEACEAALTAYDALPDNKR